VTRGRPIALLLCGGGTGGHLFPGIAVAEELRRREPDCRVLFAVAGRDLEIDTLRRHQIDTAVVASAAFKGKGRGAQVRALATLMRGIGAGRRLIARFRPDVVLGVGGYAAVPVMVAAWLGRRPRCIHEQNAVPGLANRFLARLVDRVFVSLPDDEKRFPAAKVVLTGNPVRRQIIEVGRRVDAEDDGKPPVLAVLGGSQGAHRVNELVVDGLEAVFNQLPAGLQVIHQTGAADERRVRAAYRRLGIDAEVRAFFTDMATVYQRADLVVARAGATTLAELAVTGKPSLLVPFPYAADNHQEKNARSFVESGAARMLIERQTTAVGLGRELAGLLADRELRRRMAAAARRLGRPEAAATIVDQCLALAGLGATSSAAGRT